MSKKIIQKAAERGIKLAIIPVSRLANLKDDIMQFTQQSELGEYQQMLVFKRYVLDIPVLPFSPKSIVVAVYKNTNTTASDILQQIFADAGHSLHLERWLPLKRLAVCSGLCEYGKNNITYCKEWGSFISIGGFFSDIAPNDGHIWRDVVKMQICESCEKCKDICPKGAILPRIFLIDNDKCKTQHQDKICYACQNICPANLGVVKET